MEPFVALMRKYCIDYTNSHDQSVCDEIMHPDYVVHISQVDLPRDLLYKPAVTGVFGRFPGLGLAVHEFVTNGDRHQAQLTDPDGAKIINNAAWDRGREYTAFFEARSAGRYRLECTIHGPSMTATILVLPR